MSDGDAEVIVAGAGPVGLTLAIDLGRRGVRCTLIERNPTTAPYPKMDRSNARTMELYRRIGIVDRVRALGYPPENSMNVYLCSRLSDPPIAVLEYPSVAERRRQIAESEDGRWLLEPYQLVSQNKLEPLLKEVAEGTPNVTVRYGCELMDFEQDADGVTVAVRTVDGRDETLRASYLVGCDGGSSRVRKKLGIKLDGRGRIRDLVQIIFKSDELYRRIRTGHGRHYNFVDAVGSTIIAQGCRTEFTLHSSLPPDTDFRPIIEDLIGFPCPFEILQVVPWRHNLLIADHYRDRRVFLAGDAIHLVIPSGGLGMNTGVGDAFDLAWKLAGTVDGWAGPALLDSYELERRPVALFNRELCSDLVETTRRFGRLAAAGVSRAQLAGLLEQEVHHVDNLGVHFGQRYNASPVIWPEAGEPPPWRWQAITASTWPGGRAPSVRLRNGTQLFDLLGPGYTIVDQSGRGLGDEFALAADRRQVPLTHLVVDDDAVRACWERDLVLVRPDHCVAWRGDQPPAEVNEVIDRIAGHRGISRRLSEVPRVCAQG